MVHVQLADQVQLQRVAHDKHFELGHTAVEQVDDAARSEGHQWLDRKAQRVLGDPDLVHCGKWRQRECHRGHRCSSLEELAVVHRTRGGCLTDDEV